MERSLVVIPEAPRSPGAGEPSSWKAAVDMLRLAASPRIAATVTAAGTSAGLALLVVYFWRIRFFPVESFSSAIALAGVVAASGALLTFAFVATWMVPWFIFLAACEGIGGLRAWLRDNRGEALVFVGTSVATGWVAVTLAFAVFGGNNNFLPAGHTWALCAAVLLGAGVLLQRIRRWVKGVKSLTTGAKRRRDAYLYAHLALAAAFVAAAGAMPMWAALTIAAESTSSWIHADEVGGFLLLLLVTGLPAIAGNALSAESSVQAGSGLDAGASASALAFGAVTFFGAAAGIGWPVLHDAVMSMVSVRVPAANVVFAPDSCTALRLLEIKVDAAAPGSDKSPCTISNATLLSRVGQRWLIDCGVPADRNVETFARTAFSVRAEDVLAWWQGPGHGIVATPVSPSKGRGTKCGATAKLSSRADKATKELIQASP